MHKAKRIFVLPLVLEEEKNTKLPKTRWEEDPVA